jgi:hypothetical protein
MQPGFSDYQDRLELLERFTVATQPPARESRIKAEEVPRGLAAEQAPTERYTGMLDKKARRVPP